MVLWCSMFVFAEVTSICLKTFCGNKPKQDEGWMAYVCGYLWGWMLLFDNLENYVLFISTLEIQNKLNTETRLIYCNRTELSFVSNWPETCSPNPYFPRTMMSPTMTLVRLSIWLLCWFIVLESLEQWSFLWQKELLPSEVSLSLQRWPYPLV